MCGGHLERTACRELFVRIRHDETAGVELARGFFDVLPVFSELSVSCDVHGPRVGLGFAVDHPFGQRFADAATLKEARHNSTGAPVAAFAWDRADKRVTVGREGEGSVDPGLDADILDGGVTLEAKCEFVFDAVELLLEQLFTVVPRRAVHGPVFVVNLVDADEDAVLVLPHVGEAFEVDRHWHFKVGCRDFGDAVSDEVVVLEGRDREFDAGHAADLLGPEAACVDDVFAGDRALVGHDFPAVGGLTEAVDFDAFVVFSAAFLRGGRVGLDGAGGVDVTFAVGPHGAKDTISRHDRTALLRLLGRDQLAVVDADRLEDTIVGLEPFPAFWRASKGEAAGHMEVDVLA